MLPGAIDAVDGVTAIETSGAGLTISTVLLETVPEDAEMVVVPAEMPVARPEAFMVATAVALESQLDVEVMSLVLPSL